MIHEEPIGPETPRWKVLDRLKEYAPELSRICREIQDGFDGPYQDLLYAVSQCVALLVRYERKRSLWSEWEDINFLDKRHRSLRLVQRINNLVKLAIGKRQELCGESELERAAREPDSLKTEKLLRGLLLRRGKLASLVKDHEGRLWHRWKSRPLLWWVCEMEHPDAKGLILPNIDDPAEAGPFNHREAHRRFMDRTRQKRHRQRKNSLSKERDKAHR